MKRLGFFSLIVLATAAQAQSRVDTIATTAYEAGHFNGVVLVASNGRVATQLARGYANFQFKVPLAPDTRFPIASVSKLFTAILTLQLVESARLQLDAKVAAYLPELPANCRNITIRDLLIHHSGLKNEPLRAYHAKYTPAEFSKNFVVKDTSKTSVAFNYNNVDYILLTRILEVVTKQPYAKLLQANILLPTQMSDTGMLDESRIIPRLAYGYHNYTFGSGSAKDTLHTDGPKYLSNYAGAGAVYSTTADLYKLVSALQSHKLLSSKTTLTYVLKPQETSFISYARGCPTIGFYYNDKMFSKPMLERRGSIDGFNSALLLSKDFAKVVIILSNTDTGDLEKLGDALYSAAGQ